VAFHEIQWYDRNARSVVERYFGDSVGPHALTTRWTYTVPRDRMAFVEHMFVKVRRYIEAAVVGRVIAYIQITPAGESWDPIAEAGLVTNVVGDYEECWLGQAFVLVTGDTIAAVTSDTSNGGNVDYRTIIKITEFDAYLYHATPKTRPEPLVDVQSAKPRPDPEM